MWPAASSATSRPATAASWPTTALATSARTASSAARASGAARAAGGRGGLGRGRAPRLRVGGDVRGRAAGGLVLVGHERTDPLLEIGQVLGQGVQLDIGGRAAAGEQRARPGSGGIPDAAAAAACDQPAAACGGQRPSRRASRSVVPSAEHGRRAAAVAGAAVEPAAALGGLDGAHHHRQRLGDQRAQPAAAHEGEDERPPCRARRPPGPSHAGQALVGVAARARRGRRSPAGTRSAVASGRGLGAPVPACDSSPTQLVGEATAEPERHDLGVVAAAGTVAIAAPNPKSSGAGVAVAARVGQREAERRRRTAGAVDRDEAGVDQAPRCRRCGRPWSCSRP